MNSPLRNTRFLPKHLFRIVIVVVCLQAAGLTTAAREPNFRDFDRNANKLLDPGECPPEYIAIIARYASLAGLDIRKPLPLRGLDQGRDIYFRNLDRRNDPGNVWDKPAEAGEFGKVPGKVGIRPFGAAGEMTGEYSERVWQSTIAAFRDYDSNRDGLLSRDEAGASLKGDADAWFRGDHDKNGRLTFVELSHHFASQQLKSRISTARERSTWNVEGVTITRRHRAHAEQLMKKFDTNRNGIVNRDEVPAEWKTGDGLVLADANKDGQITLEEMQHVAVKFLAEEEKAAERKEDPSLKLCENLASDMIRRYDTNKDRMLDRGECAAVGGSVREADINNNGVILAEELAIWLMERHASQPSMKLPAGLPIWFVEADLDADRQVTLAEFLQSQSGASPDRFTHYDHNRDGIVTSEESVSRAIGGKRRYTRRSPQMLAADHDSYSELTIDDDVIIADIDVELSVAKNGHDDLELRLVGPKGTVVTLYNSSLNKPWGGGPLFKDTLIDDEAPKILERLPSPPAHRSFRPQSMQQEGQPSLSVFYGKPARGTWQLAVRNKGRVAGLLEGWSLLVKPAEAE